MTINGPGIQDIVFSREKRDIVVSDIAYPNTFRVKFINDGREYGFSAKPYNGQYTLHLNEILKALEENTIAPDIPSDGYILVAPRLLAIEFSEIPDLTSIPNVVIWNIKWVPGYCRPDGDMRDMLFTGKYWWTMRPQSCITYKWSRELLQAAIPADEEEVVVNVVIDLHLSVSGKRRISYKTITVSTATMLAIVDVSYSNIASAAVSQGIDENILAYDVVGVVDGTEDFPVGQRFIVAPDDRGVRAWYFRNSLGAFDTVYSFGELTRAIDSEAKIFTISGKELEISNISKETYDVNTGYIKNERELNLWYEFLRSAERYILTEDGQCHRIVVDSSDSKKTLNEAGSISFKCRMSEEMEGYSFAKSRLEDFSEGFT